MTNKNKKILFVDDEVEFCSLMREYFSTKYDVETASDGQEALSKLEEFQPGCILLDLKMPQMDGLEALKLIKLSYPDMKVIIVSASGTIKKTEECLKEGAIDYILKPIDLDELENKIESVLGSAN